MNNKIRRATIIYEDGTVEKIESGLLIKTKVNEKQDTITATQYEINLNTRDKIAIYKSISSMYQKLQDLIERSKDK